jgi:TfoX/Sxy family transcriptional regulator of competence genes
MQEVVMASSAEYLEFVLDLMRDVPAVTQKKMMGEYLVLIACNKCTVVDRVD